MISQGVSLLLLSASVLGLGLSPELRVRYPHLKHNLDTDVIIAEAGYDPQTHTVITEDGYILHMHRIPGSGPTVFMQHGLEDSSATWVLAGPEHGAPAFRLAQAGYDVWLGNFRGNNYARAHVTYQPSDKEFWRFSWDEMAKYDLPAMLNYTLEQTGKEKIHYVGHSMGTTTFMAMNSVDQSWADRVELAVLLAPVAFMDNMESPLRYLAPFIGAFDWIAEHLGSGEFLPSSWLMDLLAGLCDVDFIDELVCKNVVFLICGYDQAQMNETMMSTIASHIPAGTSAFTIVHYGQEYKKQDYYFGGMDWGNKNDNMAHHGTEEPPVYNPNHINTKLALFYGDNDWLAAEQDVGWLYIQLPNAVEKYKVPWEGWNHFDFLYAIDIDKYQNDHLLEVLGRYPIP